MWGKSIKRCAIPGCRIEPVSLHSLPKDSSIRNEWLKFLFTDVPDRYSPTLTICSAHFSPDSFVNLSQFNAGYASKLLLKEGRVPTVLDSTPNLQSVSKISYFFTREKPYTVLALYSKFSIAPLTSCFNRK